jgi:hypothetical protein
MLRFPDTIRRTLRPAEGIDMVSVNVHPSVLNRLIAARHLIDSSGQELSALSDPLAVAQKILIAHDAAELVLLALLSQLGLKVNDQAFMAHVRPVVNEAYVKEPALIGSTLFLFEHLNRVRVDFKHYGILPDTGSSYHLYSDVLAVVDGLCDRILGRPLVDIDHTAAIHLGEVSSQFVNARSLIDQGNHRGALEAIAVALSTAFWNLQVSAAVGEPSSETALLLSGRGIDPASFLTMQRLLPIAQWPINEPAWILRKRGHEGNWTKENTEFCLRTAISTVVRLQSTPFLPRPLNFYDGFEDVLEIVTDHPLVHLVKGHFMGLNQTEVFAGLGKGDRITGQAVGQLQMGSDISQESEIDLEYAEYVAVKYPKHPSLQPPAHDDHFAYQVLWFEREDVEISYQTSERYLEIRKSYLNPGE